VCTIRAERNYLAIGASDSYAYVMNPDSGAIVQGMPGTSRWVTAVAAFPEKDADLLAAGGSDGFVRLWGYTGPGKFELRGVFRVEHEKGLPIYGLCGLKSAAGSMLAVTAGNSVELWVRRPPPSLRRTFTIRPEEAFDRDRILHGDGGTILTIGKIRSGDRLYVAAGTQRGVIQVFDPFSFGPVDRLVGHVGAVTTICNSDFGNSMLISGGEDRTIRIWSQNRIVLRGHQASVTGLCFIGNGRRVLLASSSLDRTIRLWDLERATCVLVVPVHQPSYCCGYSEGALIVGLSTGVLALDIEVEGIASNR